MIREEIANEYFEWIYDFVCNERFPPTISFRYLLEYLHHTEFQWILPRDENRAEDGIALRRRFACFLGYDDLSEYLDGPCSVLEMIAALAIRCEENIMDDTSFGNRTGQWFWGMISSLRLGAMDDDHFNEAYVRVIVERFLNRDYEPNGRGGLFTVRGCRYDLRDAEIWHQLCWYLDSIT